MDPILAQIQLFPFGFEMIGWSTCKGQTLNVIQNQALFSLIGNQFGGDGRTTFMLPNLTNASPIPGMQYYIATQGIYPTRE